MTEAELQIDVLQKLSVTEDQDTQFLLWQLGLDLGNADYHRAIHSFRRQIIIAAAKVQRSLYMTERPSHDR